MPTASNSSTFKHLPCFQGLDFKQKNSRTVNKAWEPSLVYQMIVWTSCHKRWVVLQTDLFVKHNVGNYNNQGTCLNYLQYMCTPEDKLSAQKITKTDDTNKYVAYNILYSVHTQLQLDFDQATDFSAVTLA